MNKKTFAQVITAAGAAIGAGMYYNTPAVSNGEQDRRRSKGARAFKRKKKQRRTADKSKRANRGR